MLLTWVLACQEVGVTKFNNGPEATILSHADGDYVEGASIVSLRGQVTDDDDSAGDLLTTWLLDGVEACPSSAPADDGSSTCEVAVGTTDVTVSLEVRDPSNAIGTAEIDLVVGDLGVEPPVAEILDPAGPITVALGDLVTFQGVVSDDVDGPAELTVTWSSDLDGLLAATPPSKSGVVSFQTSELSAGLHEVTLQAVDGPGLSGVDTVQVEVVDCVVSWWADADGDTYGDPEVTVHDCDPPDGFVDNPSDCDDGNPYVNPGQAEACDDGLDNDCDGSLDEGCLGTNCFEDDASILDDRYFQVAGTLDGTDPADKLGYRSDDWEVAATSGMQLAFHAWSQDFDGWLTLYDPSCVVYASSGTGARDTNAFLQARIPSDGIWTIVVTTTTPKESGDYVLELIDDQYIVGQNCSLDTDTLDVLTAPYSDSISLTLENSDSDFGGSFYYDDIEFYTFYGDDIVIDHVSSAFDPIVNVYDPDCGGVIYATDGAGGDDARLDTTIGRTGIYTITPWSEYSRETGSYTVSIEATW